MSLACPGVGIGKIEVCLLLCFPFSLRTRALTRPARSSLPPAFQYLEAELGKGTVELMETIKRTRECRHSRSPLTPFRTPCDSNALSLSRHSDRSTVDPKGILNPGKLYPSFAQDHKH